MDRVEGYREIMKRILTEVAEMTPSDDNVRTELIFDDAQGHYQLGQVGWEDKRRINFIFLHIDIYNDKIWLEHDGTNLRVAEQMVSAGVPKDQIVLGFQHPSRRPDTEYAVA